MIRVFVSIQKSLRQMGIPIGPIHAFETFRPLNKINVCALIVFIIGTTMLLFLEAKTMVEYSDAINAATAVIILNLMFINFTVITQDAFKLIEFYEVIIEKRKC